MGITQQDLADISGVALRTIKQLEKGDDANPSIKTLSKVLDVLGLELAIVLKNHDRL